MQLLHRDKPYNLDEAAARRGTPRRKRKDSRTTAYELTIRIPEERRRHFGGKKKLTRVVFALNKKVDLKGQVRAFEEEKNAVLGLALEAGGFARRRRLADSRERRNTSPQYSRF